MKSIIEMYNHIYQNYKYFYMTRDNLSEDKASRLANIIAVKTTWIEYNKQNKD